MSDSDEDGPCTICNIVPNFMFTCQKCNDTFCRNHIVDLVDHCDKNGNSFICSNCVEELPSESDDSEPEDHCNVCNIIPNAIYTCRECDDTFCKRHIHNLKSHLTLYYRDDRYICEPCMNNMLKKRMCLVCGLKECYRHDYTWYKCEMCNDFVDKTVHKKHKCTNCRSILCNSCDSHGYTTIFEYFHCSDCTGYSVLKKKREKDHVFMRRYILSDMMKGPIFDRNVVDIIASYN